MRSLEHLRLDGPTHFYLQEGYNVIVLTIYTNEKQPSMLGLDLYSKKPHLLSPQYIGLVNSMIRAPITWYRAQDTASLSLKSHL